MLETCPIHQIRWGFLKNTWLAELWCLNPVLRYLGPFIENIENKANFTNIFAEAGITISVHKGNLKPLLSFKISSLGVASAY